MKLHFVEAHAKISVRFPLSVIRKLPERICLVTDVQFIHLLDSMKKQLEASGKSVFLMKGAHARHLSQILGCSHLKLEYPALIDAFLYVGDGLFHPKALLLGSDKEVFVYNPFSRGLKKLPRSEAEAIKRHERAALASFLHSERVGVLISVKPGQLGVQAYLNQVFSLEKKFPDKKFYYLAFDTLDFSQLENFPFIECFVNTACTRLIDDYAKFPKPMVNISEVLKLEV